MGVTMMPIAGEGMNVAGDVKRPLLLAPVAWIRRAYVRIGARSFALLMAATGVLLTLPALTVGFAQDDHFLTLVFQGHPLAEDLNMGPLDNFAFSDGELATNAIRFEMGVLPWWALPDWQVSFWRPLASLTHLIEYRIFGEWALPMHVTSLLLYGVLCFAATAMYRRVMGGVWVAGLAALMFAMDPVHGIPAGWISDRNALMSALFGVLTLFCHHHWRREGRAAWLGLAVLSLGVGVFCGEAVISIGAYLFAYQLFLDPATSIGASEWRKQLRKVARGIVLLLPYLVVIVVWRVIYLWMGYGVHGSWMYIDPAANPWLFIECVFWYSPIFLLGAYAFPDGVAWNFIPDSWALLWSAFAWLFFAGMLWVMWPLLKRSAQARFWAVGSLLSVVPCSATIPGDRIITFPAMGAVALAAMFLADLLERRGVAWASKPRLRTAQAYAAVFVLCHIVLAPVALLGASRSILMMHNFFERASDSIAADPLVEQRNYIALRTPLDLLGTSMPLFLIGDNKPLPAQWRYLYAGLGALEIERPDERTLLLRPADAFLPKGMGQIFRDSRVHKMEAGYRHRVEGLGAEVLEVNSEGKPALVKFTFDNDLDDAAMRFVQWERGAYVPVELPPVGGQMVLPATSFKEVLAVTLELDGYERAAS